MTENQIPYEQEEEIDLVSLLFTVLHKYRQMAAAALVCAVLFAGVAVVKNISWNAAVQKAAEEGETAPRTSAQQTYEEDMVEYREAQNKRDTDVQSYNQQLRDNERSQQTVQFNIDNAEEYMEKSVLNSIDPYNVYNARADLYVTTDYKIMPGMDYQNPDYTSSVLSAYTSLLTNHEAISPLQSSSTWKSGICGSWSASGATTPPACSPSASTQHPRKMPPPFWTLSSPG